MAPPRDAGDEGGLRAFFALELSPAARAAVGRLVATLRERNAAAKVRWVREESLHVTLRFLGDTRADRVPALLDAVGAEVASLPPFAVSLGAPDAFPNTRRPRVLVLHVEPPEPLEALASAVERGVVAAGAPPENRRFRAHLTLGRVRPGGSPPDVTASDTARADAFPVSEAVLFRSELHPSGARYTPLGRVPLGASR